jgi:hypothetical protein
MHSGVAIIETRLNVLPHVDAGFGLTAAWFIGAMSSTGDCMPPWLRDGFAALVTKGGYLKLCPGDLFFFNANREHAWMCNHYAYLLVAPVTKIDRYASHG